MYSLIDKLEPTALAANIPTVGYNSLLILVANGSGDNYDGTEAEAKELVEGMTVKVADTTADDGEDLDTQYIAARTIAGTATALVEIVLTKAYIKTLTLGDDLTATAKFYTNPAI